ncbi:hypothetical protein, partial [Burkholderia ubonensis]|uniref:hypothetical protein n=1 Tax=Burkholderia ubonensis TaxID=101571 RepID=UPI001E54443E
ALQIPQHRFALTPLLHMPRRIVQGRLNRRILGCNGRGLARPHIAFHIGYRLDCPAIRLVKRISKPRQPGTHVRGFDLFDNSFTEIESSNGHADPTTH